MDQRFLPHFANEIEEAQWWYEQRDQLTTKAEEAAEQGELRLRHLSSPSSDSTHPLKNVTLQLSEQDLLRARKLAVREGLREEAYLVMLLHEALDTEEGATR